MIKIKIFPFNAFQVNTYLIFDNTGECAIIDAACYDAFEQQQLKEFIEKKSLKPVVLLNTHCHIDHILGNNFIHNTYHLKPLLHRDGIVLLEGAQEYGQMFGFTVKKPVMPDSFLQDGQKIRFGKQELIVLETPGHAGGSVCFYHPEEKFVIAGDVLFQNSIGRTDLPTGDYDLLIDSINQKLMVLDDDITVYPGHGPSTQIGHERKHNPFLNRVY